jgi:hypothetical protein
MKFSKTLAIVSLLVVAGTANPLSVSSVDSSRRGRSLTKQVHLKRRKGSKGSKSRKGSKKGSKSPKRQKSKSPGPRSSPPQQTTPRKPQPPSQPSPTFSSPIIGDAPNTYTNRLTTNCDNPISITKHSTLTKIALLRPDIDLSGLILANAHIEGNKVQVGDEICIPKEGDLRSLSSNSQRIGFVAVLISLVASLMLI